LNTIPNESGSAQGVIMAICNRPDGSMAKSCRIKWCCLDHGGVMIENETCTTEDTLCPPHKGELTLSNQQHCPCAGITNLLRRLSKYPYPKTVTANFFSLSYPKMPADDPAGGPLRCCRPDSIHLACGGRAQSNHETCHSIVFDNTACFSRG